VDRKLCEEMQRIHIQEIERAKSEDRVEPNWSNTIETILRKASEATEQTTRAWSQSSEKAGA